MVEITDTNDRPYRVAVESTGPAASSPALVLLNGLGDTHETWDVLLDHLPPDQRVLRYSRAGCGKSEYRPDTRDALGRPIKLPYSAIVHELKQVLDAGEVADSILMGHSFGGLVARRAARQLAGRVRGMVLVDSSVRSLIARPARQGDGEAPDMSKTAPRASVEPCPGGPTYIDMDEGARELSDEGSGPPIPVVVLARHPAWVYEDPEATPEETEQARRRGPMWHLGQKVNARLWRAPLIIAPPNTGHAIQKESPEMVAIATTAVVDAARQGCGVSLAGMLPRLNQLGCRVLLPHEVGKELDAYPQRFLTKIITGEVAGLAASEFPMAQPSPRGAPRRASIWPHIVTRTAQGRVIGLDRAITDGMRRAFQRR